MFTEITTAATFLAKYLPHKETAPESIQTFRQCLTDIMMEKFEGHWDAKRPLKGNAFRAISVFQGRLDPVVVGAAKRAGLGSAGEKVWPFAVLRRSYNSVLTNLLFVCRPVFP